MPSIISVKPRKLTFKPNTDGQFRLGFWIERRGGRSGRYWETDAWYFDNMYEMLDAAAGFAKTRNHVIQDHDEFAAFMDGKVDFIQYGDPQDRASLTLDRY